MTYPLPQNEMKRLDALYDYGILDTISEKEYDSITRIAAAICHTQASLITFLDEDRQWFKSYFGFEIRETSRDISFCNYTILDNNNVLVVPDMRADKRFSANPLVVNSPNAVFYAGAPLVTPDGYALGSICVLDGKVNHLSDEQKEALQGLAMQVMARLELQKKINQLKKAEEKLLASNKKLKDFAGIVSHDMKTPLASILLVNRTFKKRYEQYIDEQGGEFLNLITRSANELLSFIDNILEQSKSVDKIKNKGTDAAVVMEKVLKMIAVTDDIKITAKGRVPKLAISKVQLQRIFQNLITNAVKYNDKPQAEVNIRSIQKGNHAHFLVQDNGIGIDSKDLKKVFKDKSTLGVTDRFGKKGTGIGLAAVKNIVGEAGGKITLSSDKGVGSMFEVILPLL